MISLSDRQKFCRRFDCRPVDDVKGINGKPVLFLGPFYYVPHFGLRSPNKYPDLLLVMDPRFDDFLREEYPKYAQISFTNSLELRVDSSLQLPMVCAEDHGCTKHLVAITEDSDNVFLFYSSLKFQDVLSTHSINGVLEY